MVTGQPAEGNSSPTTLRQVLGLGEDLLCLAQEAGSDQVSAPETLSRQQKLILQTTSGLIPGQATLWLSEQALRRFIGQGVSDALEEASSQPRPGPSALMQLALTSQASCGAADSQSSDPWEIAGASPEREPLAIAAPMLVQDRLHQAMCQLGVLQVERLEGPPFKPGEVELLEGLALQAAQALQSSLLMASERWRREQLSLVGQVSLQIANLRDLDEISQRVTQLIQQTFNYYYTAIFTLEPGQEMLRFRASAGPSQPLLAEQPEIPVAFDARLGQGIVGAVAQAGLEFLARDVRLEERYQSLEILPETRSEAAFPLLAQDRMLGVLDVQSDQLDDFDETDLLVLRALAGSIAIAFEGAQLYEALRRRAAQLESVYEVSRAIASILDQDELLNEVVSLIQKRFGYPYVHLFTVHPGRRKIFYEAGSGLRSLHAQPDDYHYDLDDPQGIIPWVARKGELLLANDVRQEPRYRPSKLPPEDTLSELAVPLLFGRQVLGVLDIQSDQVNAFGEEDRFLFAALAEHIAIAMRNAYLYRSETWRRRVADSLREVAGLLSSDVDLDQVLEAVLTELESTLPLDAAAIWLLSESPSSEGADEPPSLHLAAVRGDGAVDLEIGLLPEEALEYNLDSPTDQLLRQASTWLLEALDSEVPVVRSAGTPFEPLGAVLGFPPDYSAISAPLRVGERPLGVLTLAHRTSGRYGSEAQAMTAAFASYAAVAIENARLYVEAHEQAWVSTVLLQVAEATQSLTSLSELLDTVIRITPMLTGVKACLLYIFDEDGTFIPAASSGLTADQQAEFERWRFAPGDVAALDHLVQEMQPVILQDSPDNLRLSSILSPVESEEGSLELGLPVLVPLVARNEVLGAFLVDYSASLPTLEMGKSFEVFFDERLAILQGIAYQTAVAVDNIRLLKSQKEEAYVSVALLQVAQAVVSSNDLEEALGSIVRITPILVGVKRAAIYLWDESQQAFRMSQAYGVPRAAGGQSYSLGEFPLLDAARLEDSLMAYPLQSGDVDEDAPGLWSRLPAPDLSRVDDYLENEACLLIAFPLSVKGKGLGVFLVEEPDPVPGESFSSGNANRRLRAKRLEIITGISQQAALAIQNDLFQKEMVERERLERELQLAREIQRAFLPETVPSLKGWDLQVCWQPAREVGGDFYDFFELPGDNLGLVIADVADKGMPAALFMTLVRTLLRATVQDLDSPAEVLKHLNDLIVPDAARGMFVTIAYVVLNLKTGELVYANAGHNPPLLLSARDGRIARFERSGMALGVEMTNMIEQRLHRLEPGDFLIMYTDGVTEAFSPEGEPFGEDGLHQAVAQAIEGLEQLPEPRADLTAQEMLEAIDRRVAAFVGEAILSDDLTLLVFKRLSAGKASG